MPRKIHIVGLMGYAYGGEKKPIVLGVKGVGKDLAYTLVAKETKEKPEISVFRVSFATDLKEMMEHYYDLDKEYYSLPQNKEKPLPQLSGWTCRKIWEIFGTEVVRKRVQRYLPHLEMDMENIWIEHASQFLKWNELSRVAQITAQLFQLSAHECLYEQKDKVIPRLGHSFQELVEALQKAMNDYEMPPSPFDKYEENVIVFVTDLRFYNEYKALKKQGAKFIQIRRRLPVPAEKDDHITNQVDPRMKPDYVIYNNQSPERLADSMMRVLRDWEMLPALK